MRKIIPALVILIALGACFPLPSPGLATPTAVIATTQAPPSLVPSPLPSATPVLANPTVTSPPTSHASLSETPTLVPTAVVDLTATFVTATAFTSVASATPTLVPGLPTASPTLGIRLYGTLPPHVPFNEITIINRARAEAYISLQVTIPDGRYSILEYPVERRVKVNAPLGSYLYVAWVGGNKMVGTFRLDAFGGLTIDLYRDRVVVH